MALLGRNVRERLRLGPQSRYRRKKSTSTLRGREERLRNDENGGGSGSGYKEGSGRLLGLRLGSGVLRRGEPLVSLLGARWAICLINLPFPLLSALICYLSFVLFNLPLDSFPLSQVSYMQDGEKCSRPPGDVQVANSLFEKVFDENFEENIP